MKFESKLKKRYASRVDLTPKPMAFLKETGIAEQGYAESSAEAVRYVRRKHYHNPGKRALGISLGVIGVAAIVIPAAVIIPQMIVVNEHPSIQRIRYSQIESEIAETDSFKALNHITYQEQQFQFKRVSEEYRNAVNDFAGSLASHLDLRQGTVFSPLACYLNLDILSEAGDAAAKAIYDSVLGPSSVRAGNYRSTLRTNFYSDDLGSAKIYNAYFFGLPAKQSFVDYLTGRDVEAYSASFQTDLGKIADWANQRVGEQDGIKPADFSITDDTAVLRMTLMDFDAHWHTPFLKENTKKETFHGADKDAEAEFMTHSVYVPWQNTAEWVEYRGAYEYDKYISAYDVYEHDYTIQYLVPKSLDDSIFDLLDGVDFLTEDKTKYCVSEELYRRGAAMMQLSVPKFSMRKTTDLDAALKASGLGDLYHKAPDNHVLTNALDSSDPNGSWIEEEKQINRIEFNEDGTKAKTYHWGAMGAGSAMHMSDGLVIRLDQPFVYVIRDPNGLPMYIGSVANI